MIRTIIVVAAFAMPVLAQTPAARLGVPTDPATARGSNPDPFQDGPRLPAARLGPVSSARVGEGPERASADERYNWGATRDRRATPASRSRERDSVADRDRRSTEGALLNAPRPGARTANGRLTANGDDPNAPPPPPPPPAPTWWPERERDLADLRDQFPAFGDQNRDRLAFQSDCAFDHLSSPITNPFLAEDPRSLTELRPIFLYQTIPTSNPYFQGGSAVFLGVQARAAFTDRFSVVLHKFGMQSFNGDNPFVTDGSGLSEVWLSPKFVFWRAPDTQTLASFGLQFQIPMGAGRAFQDTGTLGLVPYLSIGRQLGELNWGMVNLINVAGYHIGSSDSRSDYFFNSLHLDIDWNNEHRFYPTLELNWFNYTSNGTERALLPFEGRDLANIGGSADGKNYLSIAPGLRYRFTDYLQLGVATEFGLVGANDTMRFRLGIDLIWRY